VPKADIVTHFRGRETMGAHGWRIFSGPIHERAAGALGCDTDRPEACNRWNNYRGDQVCALAGRRATSLWDCNAVTVVTLGNLNRQSLKMKSGSCASGAVLNASPILARTLQPTSAWWPR